MANAVVDQAYDCRTDESLSVSQSVTVEVQSMKSVQSLGRIRRSLKGLSVQAGVSGLSQQYDCADESIYLTRYE